MLPLASLIICAACMPSQVASYAYTPLFFLAAIVVTLCIKDVFVCDKLGEIEVYTLTAKGQLILHASAQEQGADHVYTLHPESKIMPWGVALSVYQPSDYWYQRSSKHLRWVLKGECPARDYRRLCRVLAQTNLHPETRKTTDVS
ncbi:MULTISPECIES: protein YgfX [Alteromonas]|uniref:protein YgfX n=1 Tax=Alteromonas TaxID=226 RepID=UPI002FC35B7A